jgi:hypothetical protein
MTTFHVFDKKRSLSLCLSLSFSAFSLSYTHALSLFLSTIRCVRCLLSLSLSLSLRHPPKSISPLSMLSPVSLLSLLSLHTHTHTLSLPLYPSLSPSLPLSFSPLSHFSHSPRCTPACLPLFPSFFFICATLPPFAPLFCPLQKNKKITRLGTRVETRPFRPHMSLVYAVVPYAQRQQLATKGAIALPPPPNILRLEKNRRKMM